MIDNEKPRRPHPRLKHPLPGRIERTEETSEFAVACVKCGRTEFCDFGVHGPEFIPEMLDQAGWSITGKGKRQRVTCDKCKG